MQRKSYRRRQLIKAFFVFQCKLFLDWFRDLVFSPVAMFCVVADLISGADEKNGMFNRLMVFGAKTDHWINMFNTHTEDSGPHFDHLVDRAEDSLRKRNKTN